MRDDDDGGGEAPAPIRATSHLRASRAQMQHVPLLPFQHDILRQAEREPKGLWVVARGLGLIDVMHAYLASLEAKLGSTYPDGARPLALFMFSGRSAPLYASYVRCFNPSTGIKEVTGKYDKAQRMTIWKQGGCHFVRSCILVVDLLKQRIQPGQVYGLYLVMDKSTPLLCESSTEAFAVRLCHDGRASRRPSAAGLTLLQATTRAFASPRPPPNTASSSARTPLRVQAFTEDVLSLGAGFSSLEEATRVLRAGAKAFFWSRFRTAVRESLHRAPSIVQLYPELSPKQAEAHEALVRLARMTLAEIVRAAGPAAATDPNWTLNDALCRSHRQNLAQMQQLAARPRAGARIRRLLGELRTLRNLLHHLVHADAVSFYLILSAERKTSDWLAAHQTSPAWLMDDDADLLFHLAESRLYTTPSTTAAPRQLALEPIPKIQVTLEAVREICSYANTPDAGLLEPPVLIAVDSPAAANGLAVSLATGGPGPYLRTKLRGLAQLRLATQGATTEPWRGVLAALDAASDGPNTPPRHSQRPTGTGFTLRVITQTHLQLFEPDPDPRPAPPRPPPLLISTARDVANVLHDLAIHFVILYDAAPELVRQIECYKNAHPGRFVRAYFIMYQRSDEERQYLGGMHREQEAFKKCIRDKSQMARQVDEMTEQEIRQMPALDGPNRRDLTDQGKSIDPERLKHALRESNQENPLTQTQLDLEKHALRESNRENPLTQTQLDLGKHALRESNQENPLTQTQLDLENPPNQNPLKHLKQNDHVNPAKRKASLTNQPNAYNDPTNAATAHRPYAVVVDAREFRSKLPGLLHLNGMQIIPKTLVIADYLLTPTLAVERKSLNDLQQSLIDGRLFRQLRALSRTYASPVLLIEMDQILSPELQQIDDLTTGPGGMAVSSKLVLLAYAFPNLRILWSRSVHETATLFAALKRGQPEPVAPNAQGSLQNTDEGREAAIAQNLAGFEGLDVLRRIPGLAAHHLLSILFENGGGRPISLAELGNWNLAQWAAVIGRDGENAFRWMHRGAGDEISQREKGGSLRGRRGGT